MPSWQDEDYYSLLGLSREATDDEIRAAFRQQVKRHHPDFFPANTPAKLDAEERFKRIKIAQDILLDPVTRSQYNASLTPVQDRLWQWTGYDFGLSENDRPIPHPSEPEEEAPPVHFTQAEIDPHDAQTASRRRAAAMYISQGNRYYAQKEYDRALAAFRNALLLDPNSPVPNSLMVYLRRLYYNVD